jgi:DNA polymerase I-like protein with 3'-5' exonuclease and polymerase domains
MSDSTNTTPQQQDELDRVIDLLIAEDEPKKPGYLAVGDFHSKNAQAFFGDEYCRKIYEESPKKYKDEVRAVGKVAGLALVYGSSWKMFLDIIPNCTEAQAKSIYNNFFNSLPRLKAWSSANIANMYKTGTVKTILGRVIHIKDYDSDNWSFKSKAERNARNAPIQGSGASIIRYILLKLYNLIDEHKLSRFVGTYAFSNYYTRILSLVDPTEEQIKALEVDLDNQPEGNCKIIIQSNGAVTQEYDRNVQMLKSLVTKHNLSIIL